MTASISHLELPTEDGASIHWSPTKKPIQAPAGRSITSRKVFAATHVVANPTSRGGNQARDLIDWEATLAFRRHVWSLGLGVAEAMDTAQRGSGLDWTRAKELIARTAKEAADWDPPTVYGVATDQLNPPGTADIEDVEEAYREQVAFVESVGGTAVMMASRHLVRCARSTEDYLAVYGSVIQEVSRPVLVHWLGDMFDPQLEGYWGSNDRWEAMEVVLELIQAYPTKIDGVKVSLLDHELERAMRKRLPESVRLYTGDDFNFAELILGDGEEHSDALLGIFDPIAIAAATALQALDDGNLALYREVLEPTVPLSRHLFGTPTENYKTGIVFLAYLNGHQDHFLMLAGAERRRSLAHLSRLLVLADDARILLDPELAVHRMRRLLALSDAG